MNRIEIQYFAVLRERAGTGRETVETAAANLTPLARNRLTALTKALRTAAASTLPCTVRGSAGAKT